MRAAVLALVALTLSGCETTAQRSAILERAALREVHGQATNTGLVIHRRSQTVKVIATALLHSSEGTAAVLTLRNVSNSAVIDSPLLVSVRAGNGSLSYSNGAAGLAHSLVAAPVIQPHGEITWVDDQVQGTGDSAVAATVGEGSPIAGPAPRVEIVAGRLIHEAGIPSADGTAVNRSSVAQRELTVYAIATQAGRTVAAGRAVLPSLGAHSSAPFQIYLIGDPSGALLHLSAPPTSG